MNNIEEKLKNIFLEEQLPPTSYDFMINKTLNNLKFHKKHNYKNIKLAFTAVCCSLLLITGTVFAKDIEKFIIEKFGLGKGVETAINNGYIESPEMDYVGSSSSTKINEEIVDTINAKSKINDFFIDDYNLSVEFYIQFDDNIKDIINLENINTIELQDLIIVDEKNRILYDSNNKERFEEYCKENNLPYKYKEFNENYINSGLNSFPRYNMNGTYISLIYNMYSDKYPISQKLNFSFTKIQFTESDNPDKKISITGDWSISLEVPENMIERSYESYKMISCDNENFNVYTARVTDTGFELGIMISNVSRPEYPQELRDYEKEFSRKVGIITNRTNGVFKTTDLPEAYGDLYEVYRDYEFKNTPISTTGESRFLPPSEDTDGTYILNSKGEKFECTMSPGRKSIYQYLSNNTYNYYETFNMTKSNATDTCDVIVDFRGEEVKLKLEKIKTK